MRASAIWRGPSSPAPPLSISPPPKKPNWRGPIMSEQTEPGAAAHGDPLAVALATAAANRNKADAFLELQMEEIHRREPYEISHLRLRSFSGWIKAAFEASLGLLALAVVAGLGLMVWSAAHADGFVIQSFSVPPDLAARGLNGEVVASKLLDQIRIAQTLFNTVAQDPAVSRNSSNDIKVEFLVFGFLLCVVFCFLCVWLGFVSLVGGVFVLSP